MAREINKIILHCSASDSALQSARTIDIWHRDRGWHRIGYHYFIRKNGLIEGGRYVEEVGAHCKGENANSIGICLAGNRSFNRVQFESLERLLLTLSQIWPDATVHGHNEFNSNKLCPVFKVQPYRDLYKQRERTKPRWKAYINSFFQMLLALLKPFSRS